MRGKRNPQSIGGPKSPSRRGALGGERCSYAALQPILPHSLNFYGRSLFELW